MMRRFLIGVAAVIVCLLCLPALPRMAMELIRRLPLGWGGFLRRTLPEVTTNWHGIGMVAVCSVILLFGLHSLGGWLYGAGGSKEGGGRAWSWRWTGVVFGSFWLLFALVMGASGLSRQLVWLSEFDGPLYVERQSGWMEIKQADLAIRMALQEEEDNGMHALASFRNGEHERAHSKPTLWEAHHVLLFTNANGRHVGHILVPRDPQARQRIGFLVSGAEWKSDQLRMTNLPTVIARLEAQALQE